MKNKKKKEKGLTFEDKAILYLHKILTQSNDEIKLQAIKIILEDKKIRNTDYLAWVASREPRYKEDRRREKENSIGGKK